MGFDMGIIPFNPDGWGPSNTSAVPLLPKSEGSGTHLANIPFAPFSRLEKLGRIANWTRNPNFNNPAACSATGRDTVFDFALDESSALAATDDDSFRLVDGKPPAPLQLKFGPCWHFQQCPQLPQHHDEEVEARKREAEKERTRHDCLYHLHRSSATSSPTVAACSRDSPALKSSIDI